MGNANECSDINTDDDENGISRVTGHEPPQNSSAGERFSGTQWDPTLTYTGPKAGQIAYESAMGVIAHTIQKVQSMRRPGDTDRVCDHFNFVLQALQVAQSNAGSIDVCRAARDRRG
jgi:hypothetical protein